VKHRAVVELSERPLHLGERRKVDEDRQVRSLRAVDRCVAALEVGATEVDQGVRSPLCR
jgi:hypothetical protein